MAGLPEVGKSLDWEGRPLPWAPARPPTRPGLTRPPPEAPLDPGLGTVCLVRERWADLGQAGIRPSTPGSPEPVWPRGPRLAGASHAGRNLCKAEKPARPRSEDRAGLVRARAEC
jgi:hypothetical protein